MPVEKFRSIEEMNQAPIATAAGAGFARFARHCQRWWRLAPRVYPRGVFKFRSIEEAQEARAEVSGNRTAPGMRAGDDGASPELAALSEEHRAWALHSAALWREAREIVGLQPNLDVGDVYHALRTLELPPAERLRRGLTRVRLREARPRGAPVE